VSGQQLVAPERVGNALGHVVEQSKVGRAAQEEGVVEAKHGDPGPREMAGLVSLEVPELVQAVTGPGEGQKRRQEFPRNVHGSRITAQSATQLSGQRVPPVQQPLEGVEWIVLNLSFGPQQDPQTEVHDVVRGHRELIAELPIDHTVALIVPQDVLTAKISEMEQSGAGHSSIIDYTLTSDISDLSFLPPRTLHILTNDNADGSHRIVINGEGDDIPAFHVTEGQIRGTVDAAREALRNVHFEEYGGTLGSKRQRRNLLNSKNFRRPEVTNLIFNFDGTVQSGAGDPRQIQLGVRVLW